MPNLSTLTVTLSANSAKLVAAFNQSQRRARTWSQRMRGAARTAARGFGILSTAAVGSLSALTQAGLKSADSLAKTADKLGILPNELAGLRFAAEQTGVDINKLDLGLQRMVRRVAEAAQGTGEAQGALKELGLDARALAAQSPDEQFRSIADAMARVGNQSDRVRLGFKLFDSEGVALINTLKAGRAGLNDFTREAERLGLALGTKQLANIQNAADAGNRMNRAFAGLGRQLAGVFAPAMIQSANYIARLVSRVTNAIPKLAGMASAFAGVRREVENLTRVELRAELEEIFRAIDAQKNRLAELQEQQSRTFDIEVGEQLRASIERAERRLADLQSRSAEVQKAMRDLRNEVERPLSANAEILPRRSIEDAKELISQANTELEKTFSLIDRLSSRGQSIFESTRTPIEQFIARMREARELNEQGLLPGGEDTIGRLREQLLGGILEPVEEIGNKSDETFGTMTEFGIQAARNLQTAFGDRLRNGAEQGFKGILNSFSQMLQDMLAQLAASKALEAFFGLFKGNTGVLGEISRGFLDKRASGGPFSGTRPVLVGEKGPELLFPGGRPGFVMPNSQLGGGGNVQVNVINAPAQTRTRERTAGGARIIDVILPALAEDLAQNGQFAQALAGNFGISRAFASR